MKKITPRIDDSAEKFLKTKFNTTNAGSEYCLNSLYPVFRKFIALDLKGKFTGSELTLMIDVMNGTMLISQFAGQHLSANVSDGIVLDALDVKWEIDPTELKEKLISLSTPELFFLEIWIHGFWVQNTKKNMDLDKYIEGLAA